MRIALTGNMLACRLEHARNLRKSLRRMSET
jgi:hypothetical protein